jgi:CBS domain-containing protein
MRIRDVLRTKGDDVATVSPEATVAALLDRLAERRVGAMVVQNADQSLVGIVSERDVVRALHADGAALLDLPVARIMTAEVTTCAPTDSIEHVMRLMTEQRVRHVPVLAHGRLAGIVSIGDVVKSRIDDLQSTTKHLESYITGR